MRMVRVLINLVCALALVFGFFNQTTVSAAASGSNVVQKSNQHESTVPSGLSTAEWESVKAQMAAAEYQVTWQKRAGEWAYRAPNRAQGFEATFASTGFRAAGWKNGQEDWSFGLALKAYGGLLVEQGKASAVRERVTTVHGTALSEWYENRPEGVKHGLTLNLPPAVNMPPARSVEQVTLDFALTGSLKAEMLPGGGLLLRNSAGAAELVYDGLSVSDAAGRPLEAHMSLDDRGLRFTIQAKGALYPLTVDPLLHAETKILLPSDAQANDRFGTTVAVDANTIVVSASGKDSATYGNGGTVYVFDRNRGGPDGWGEVAVLHASDGQFGDAFGHSLAIDGDTIVVGAFLEDGGDGDPLPGAGAAYVFQRRMASPNIWDEVKILRGSQLEAFDEFGISVDIDGNTIVVGADQDDDPSNLTLGSGAVYVFMRNQGGMNAWGEVDYLTPNNPTEGEGLGSSVAIDGSTIVAGAAGSFGSSGTTIMAGAAYVYELNAFDVNQWAQVSKLFASDGQENDLLGLSVDIDGDTIVVGAYGEDGGSGDPLTDSGAAYVYQRNLGGAYAWGQVTILRASDAQAVDRFGYPVVIDDNSIVVGAYSEDGGAGDPLPESGAAYVFNRNQGGADVWGEINILRASDRMAGDEFATSLAIDGDVIVSGIWSEQYDTVHSAGGVYLFSTSSTWQIAGSLHASDRQAGDQFGSSVAIDGNTLVVGAYLEDGGDGDINLDAGQVYVFYRNRGGPNAWGEAKKMYSSGPQPGDYFGMSVAIDGDVIVVGIPNDSTTTMYPDEGSGAAYVFNRNMYGEDFWGEVAILFASNGGAGDQFGFSVDISGDTIVVGAPSEDGEANTLNNSGAAYVFQRDQGGLNSWGEVKVLRNSTPQAGDAFGGSAAIDGNLIVVGACLEIGITEQTPYSGAAHVFERNQDGPDAWGELVTLRAPDFQEYDGFGISVAIEGDIIVVGANREDGGPGNPILNAGAAYVFQRSYDGVGSPWMDVTSLHALDAQVNDAFGSSVAISGNTIVVGAIFEDGGPGDPVPDAGAAYVFNRNLGGADAWGQIRTLRASTPQVEGLFGSVAIDGETLVVGAENEQVDSIQGAGGVYIYTLQAGWESNELPLPSGSQPGDRFGSVALSGDTLVIGAPDKDGGEGDSLPDTGAAYVYYRSQNGLKPWQDVAVLRASDAQANDHFGTAVAIDGERIVVGAPGEDGGAGDPAPDAGAAYVFERNQGGADVWGQTVLLRASDAQSGDGFGSSVAVKANTIIVGAPGEDGSGDLAPDAGKIYVFEFTTPSAGVSIFDWGQVDLITASDGQAGDQFGYAVGLSENTLAVGAPGEDGGAGDPTSNAGAVYIFEFTTPSAGVSIFDWGQIDLISANRSLGPGDSFGSAVALDGNTLVVGAPGDDGGDGDPLADAGAAYLFAYTPPVQQVSIYDWGQVDLVRAGDGAGPGDGFGSSVSLSGSTAIIGAPGEDGGPGDLLTDAGAAYLFIPSTANLQSSGAAGSDSAGWNAAGWSMSQVLRSPEAQSGDQFGLSVVIDANTLAVGAPYEDGGQNNSMTDVGATYTFQNVLPNLSPVLANDYITVKPNTTSNVLVVLANDGDPNGDLLLIMEVSTPAHGTATNNGVQIVYTPEAGFRGVDSFTYTVTDGNGGYATATVKVNVGAAVSLPLIIYGQ